MKRRVPICPPGPQRTENRSGKSIAGRIWPVFFLVVLHLVLPGPAAAQNACELALSEADKAYQSGDFKQVVDLLTPCLEKGGLTARERVEAYRLLAMTDLATDHPDRAKAAVRKLLGIKSDYETSLYDPPRFVRMVEEVKQETGTILVTSVSKNSENILEAPATVVLITAKQIRQRGYQNLEEIFHDLPGFDISRGNGVQYSVIYQRGYRSNATDKTLFLIDGVEENDLWTNFTEVSRQYPLSNIDRIEVIYGPASTMYGANAFLGVVNIITKNPADLVERGKSFGAHISVDRGTWDTRYVDGTVAAVHENFSASFTGRLFRSNEMDLSKYPDWDYKPHDVAFYKDKLAVQGMNPDGTYQAQTFLNETGMDPNSPYVTVTRDAAGVATALEVTEAGAEKARAFDAAALSELVNGKPIRYTNSTDDWLLNGKIRTGGLTLGVQTWRRDEGTIGWFVDDREGPSDNGGVWIPKNTFLYMKYDKAVTDNLYITIFNRYKSHSLDSNNQILSFNSYAGEGRLNLADLVKNTPSNWTTLYFYQLSNELRLEARALYTPSERFNLVSGLEVRNGHIQGNYITSPDPNPAQTGSSSSIDNGSNYFETRDVGFYSQASYRARKTVKLVLGGRVDHDRIQETEGYGTVFNGRAAAVYSPSRFVFKAIFSQAFKAASNWAKYATSPSRGIPNPNLQPERVNDFDLGAGWRVSSDLSLDMAAYWATYSDVVGATKVLLPDGTFTTQNQAIGKLLIRGLQADATWKFRKYTLWGNYTYTDPMNVKPTDSSGNPILDANGKPKHIRIGDISSNRINLGVNALFRKHLEVNLRMNFVGARPTGKNTTVSANPYNQIDAYTILNGALTYKDLAPGLSFQVLVNNALNEIYFDPGVRSADGKIQAARFPQNTRNLTFRFLVDF